MQPGMIDVRDWGAYSDGRDCSGAITKAIRSLHSAGSDGGGTLYFPPGCYWLDSPIDFRADSMSTASMSTAIHIQGSNPVCTGFDVRCCVLQTRRQCPVFVWPHELTTAHAGFRMSDIVLECEPTRKPDTAGVEMWTGSSNQFRAGFVFENVGMFGFEHAVRFVRSAKAGDQMAVGRVFIDRCCIMHNTHGVICEASDHSWLRPIINHLVIRDSRISGNAESGIDVIAKGATIDGNCLEGQPRGLTMVSHNCQGVSIHGNYFEANREHYMRVKGYEVDIAGNYWPECTTDNGRAKVIIEELEKA